MIDERKERVIELLIKGENITDIAKITGISRTAIYNWLGDNEFKAELDKQTQEIKTSGQKKMTSRLNTYLDELEKLALTSASEKVRSDNLQYLIDRILGRATTKVADVTEETKEESSIDLEKELNDLILLDIE